MQGFDFEQNPKEFVNAIHSLLEDSKREEWTLNEWKKNLQKKLFTWSRTLKSLLECFDSDHLILNLKFFEKRANDFLKQRASISTPDVSFHENLFESTLQQISTSSSSRSTSSLTLSSSEAGNIEQMRQKFEEYLGEELLCLIKLMKFLKLFLSESPPIPVERVFNNEGTLLRENLPAMLNSEQNILDLTFLSGDLGDPNGTSPTVKGILNSIQKGVFGVHFLRGVSGCGKTKALLDVGRHHFLFFFTLSKVYSSPDVQKCLTTCRSILDRSRPQEDYHVYSEQCRITIELMLFQRILAFFVLRELHPQLTPWQWILFQLSFSFSGTPQQTFLRKVMSCVNQPKEWPLDMMSVLSDVVSILRSRNRTNEKFLIAVDEAQVLLDIGKDQFRSNRGFNRSFYSFFMKQIVNLGLSILIAGSSLSLQEVEELESAYVPIFGPKPGFQKHNFRAITTRDESDKFLRRLFKKEVLNDNVLNDAFLRLQGRMRFYTTLADLATNKEILEFIGFPGNNTNTPKCKKDTSPQTFTKLLDLWETIETKTQTQWENVPSRLSNYIYKPIYNVVSRFASKPPFEDNRTLLSRIATDYWLGNIVMLDPEQGNALLSSGVGFILAAGEGITQGQPEPVVLKAIFNWFRDNNESMAYYYAKNRDDSEAQEFGGIFDKIVAVCLLELQGKILKKIPLFNEVSFLTDDFKLEASHLEKCLLFQYFQFDKPYEAVNKPEEKAHPDLVYYIRSAVDDRRILLLTSHKTTTTGRGIERSKVENAFLGMDINKLYYQQTGEQQEQQKQQKRSPNALIQRRDMIYQKLVQDFQNGKLVGIIRLLIGLPRFQEGASEFIEAEKQKTKISLKFGNMEVTIPQCLLVVTEKNLKACGLFPGKLCNILWEKFQCKEQNEQKSQKKLYLFKIKKRKREKKLEEQLTFEGEPKRKKQRTTSKK